MKVVPVPGLDDNYAYLVIDEDSGDAAAIDPVLPDRVLQAAQLNGAEVKMVLTTHHYGDDAGGDNGMTELLKEVPVYGGVKDEVEGWSHPVQHGDEFSISPSIRVRCLDTPCHTEGHISYFISSTVEGDKPVVFTGDTLFRGGCGRSFEGTPDQMYNSLCETLASLPPETQVYCGHEDHSISTRMEIDVRRSEDGHEQPAGKKPKRDHGDVEMGLRQTAEIVMVLVGVAALRGGAQPSSLECQLAAQAYEKLAALVAVSAPEDLVSQNALQSLIQQLTVPPPAPARPAAKLIAIQSSTASLSSPSTPTPESTPSSAPSAPAQAGATPSPSSSSSVSPSPSPAPGLVDSSSETGLAVATTSKAVVSAPKAGSPALEAPLEQVQTPSSSQDNAAPSSSPGKTTNVPGKTRSSAHASSTSVPVAISTTPTLRTKSGDRTSPAEQATTTVTIKDQRGNQAPKALARQRGSKSVVPEQVVVLDPVEIHRQIALAVQLLLKPYIITTALSKTAGNYMNTPVSCGICKAAASTTNNILVCDGCECGFHLQCLQLSFTTSIPKGDWYCPKCVTTNAGRPQPPKYGPLRRAPAGQSGPKNSWSMQAGRGSDASSKGQPSGKLLLQSRRKDFDAAEPSSPPSSRHEAVARRHSMEEYARDRAQKPGASEQDASDQSLKLEWLGPVLSSGQEKLYYSACSVGGVIVRLQDAAFFRPEASDVPPYIARLQALWEDKSSGQKWVKVNWCYYPSDLPVNSGRPVICDPREVYESNHSDNNLVGSIQGPCLVLSPVKYQEELDRRSKNPKEDPIPLFLCQWFYDAPKGLFRASSDDFF